MTPALPAPTAAPTKAASTTVDASSEQKAVLGDSAKHGEARLPMTEPSSNTDPGQKVSAVDTSLRMRDRGPIVPGDLVKNSPDEHHQRAGNPAVSLVVQDGSALSSESGTATASDPVEGPLLKRFKLSPANDAVPVAAQSPPWSSESHGNVSRDAARHASILRKVDFVTATSPPLSREESYATSIDDDARSESGDSGVQGRAQAHEVQGLEKTPPVAHSDSDGRVQKRKLHEK